MPGKSGAWRYVGCGGSFRLAGLKTTACWLALVWWGGDEEVSDERVWIDDHAGALLVG